MSSVGKSRYDGSGSPPRPARLNPGHYRCGRWVLLREAVLIAGLGLWGLLGDVCHSATGSGFAGVALAAASTLAHSILLLAFGVLLVVATPWRRLSLIMTGAGTVGSLLLFVIGTVAAVRGAPGFLGYGIAESVLHAVLLGFNLALFIWLSAGFAGAARVCPVSMVRSRGERFPERVLRSRRHHPEPHHPEFHHPGPPTSAGGSTAPRPRRVTACVCAWTRHVTSG